MSAEKKYKLVGSLNIYNIVPNFIYPIFQDEDFILYWGFTDDEMVSDIVGPYYTRFLELPSTLIDKVKFLKTTENTLENINEYYKVGDLAVCGTELDKDKIYIGSLDKYLEYIKKSSDNEQLSKYWKDQLCDEIEYIEPLVQESQKKLVRRRKQKKEDQ
jgi:hypothetical protein